MPFLFTFSLESKTGKNSSAKVEEGVQKRSESERQDDKNSEERKFKFGISCFQRNFVISLTHFAG